ncbi:hypothetical protein B0J18DRAFT_85841 [Chaetomium sp. MPI-SDFR-AT-0129]|nr:hypothetical protein B0J18DRAFT_85841 [Chaetomium sp. MPI-SDFR-AT-0129]
MATPADVQQATLARFVAGWKNWSAAEMAQVWSEDYTQAALPFSLGHPPRTRAQVEATLPLLQKVVTDYELTIHNVVHDTAQGKAVVYALSKGTTPFGKWDNEYAVFFTFDQSREHIVKIEEMVDTAFMKEFFPKFQNFVREQQQQQQQQQ